MESPVVFYTKCRPQSVDAWPIARDYRIVFVGYPPWKPDANGLHDDQGYKGALFDVSRDPECARHLVDVSRGYRTQVTKNANLAASVIPGSIVVVPRPSSGECHFASVVKRFKVIDAPDWCQRYLDLRKDAGKECTPADEYVADVVQCWRVDEWQMVPFPLVPRWISYRLLSRNTAGVIKPVAGVNADPHVRITDLLQNGSDGAREVTSTASLLAEWVSPSIFEHLMVHLLQLEAPDGERWHHVGGSGDGGVDGLAVAASGEIVGVLQCKWYYSEKPSKLALEVANNVRVAWPNAKVVVAVLLSPFAPERSNTVDGVSYLGLQEIVALVEKHRESLPLARTLGIHAR
ncbi:MAG: restriction endonuclease [Gemmatimonadetes bacterium]|nr:restriction endonuclease [Gemmatimonadota bacterium]